MPKTTTGVLLANVGTPDAPTTGAVRRYLRQFLSDPRVLTMPAISRWLLLNLVILPFRPKQSAEAYSKVWMPEGSPLLYHSNNCASALQDALGESHRVVVGMRYGNPSLAHALEQLEVDGLERLVIVPMFPQYASASTGTVVQELMAQIGRRTAMPAIQVVPPFYDSGHFIGPLAASVGQAMAEFAADHLVLSYHGLPQSHVEAVDAEGHGCDRVGPCPAVGPANVHCYRAQCFATSRALAAHLGLTDYTVAFQSRLGRAVWITPEVVASLAGLHQRGFRRLAVAMPAFVADCLETVEEVGMRLRHEWQALGGEDLLAVPCLNANPDWVAGLAALIQDQPATEKAGQAQHAALPP